MLAKSGVWWEKMPIRPARSVGFLPSEEAESLVVSSRTIYDSLPPKGIWLQFERRPVKQHRSTPADLCTAYVLSGIAWLHSDQPDLAMADFDAAAQIAPDDPAPVFNRGLVHRCAGRWSEALRDFSTAIRLDPQDPDSFVQRGCILRQLGQDSAAFDDFTSALERDPHHCEAMNSLAGLLVTTTVPELRNPFGALRLARRAMEFTPEINADLYDTLAAACAACGRFEEAVFWQCRALESASVEDHFCYLRRLRYYQRKQIPPTNLPH